MIDRTRVVPEHSGCPAIVLTGTIIPNTVDGPRLDPAQRRAEYLAAIRFYRQFAPVYFLENSSYALQDDPDFTPARDFYVRKFPLSARPERGKGYQEFEMLDAWVTGEAEMPGRWLKVTGRYIVRNVAEILADCARAGEADLVIDQERPYATARTHLFAVNTEYYRQWIRGVYAQADDREGRWIELVLFAALRSDHEARFAVFAHQPVISAIAGSSGRSMQSKPTVILARRVLRAVNRCFDRRYLWFAT